MRKIILLVCLLFAFSVSAQENGPPNLPVELPGAFESIPPPEETQPSEGLPQQVTPREKKSLIKEPETVSRVEVITEKEESKVFLDFRNADIKDVMRTLSKISGVSILVSKGVEANVTVNIEGVPWKKALKLILRTYNLTMIEKDGFIIIVTYKQIQEEQAQVPLDTVIITLNFVDIEEAKTYLKSVMTTGRGLIEGDKRTNSLILTDTPEAIEKARKIVHELDKKTPQVLIEVLMVDVKIEDEFSLGIDWSLTDTRHEGTDLDRNISQTLQLTGSGAMALTYGKSLLDYARLQTTIEALSSNQRVNVIANPKILTLNNEIAKIEIIEQIPYTSETSSSEGGTSTSTQFKDAGVTLQVKPQITPDGHIILDVKTEQSFRTGFTPDSEPIIDSRTSQSTMMIVNGQTVVIGGLRKKDDTSTITKVPFLGSIPWLGKLFSREVSAYITREFLIFITPTVVEETMEVASSDENKKSLRKQVFHNQEIRKKARADLKYDDSAEEKSTEGAEKARQKAERERLKTEAADEKARQKAEHKRLKTEAADEKARQKAEHKKEIRREKEKIKENLAEFDNLDILPLKGPDEAN